MACPQRNELEIKKMRGAKSPNKRSRDVCSFAAVSEKPSPEQEHPEGASWVVPLRMLTGSAGEGGGRGKGGRDRGPGRPADPATPDPCGIPPRASAADLWELVPRDVVDGQNRPVLRTHPLCGLRRWRDPDFWLA